jgi:hypothetical protein
MLDTSKKLYITTHAFKRLVGREGVGSPSMRWSRAHAALFDGKSVECYQGDFRKYLERREFNNKTKHENAGVLRVYGGYIYVFVETPDQIVLVTVIEIPECYAELDPILRQDIKKVEALRGDYRQLQLHTAGGGDEIKAAV